MHRILYRLEEEQTQNPSSLNLNSPSALFYIMTEELILLQ